MPKGEKAKYYIRPDGLHEAIRTINGKRMAFRGKTDKEVDRKILEHREVEEKGRSYKAVINDWWREKRRNCRRPASAHICLRLSA